jgi:DNA-binding response OmpR family regulator
MSDKKSILIVDDDVSSRDILAAILFNEDYRLEFAADGQELLEKAETFMPDAVLLDVLMPDMDGFEACRRFKAMEHCRNTPVIMISVLKDKEDITQGFESGADDFMSKPVNGPELRARIRAALRIKERYDEIKTGIRLREHLGSMIMRDMKHSLNPVLEADRTLEKYIGDSEALKKISRAAHRIQRSISHMLMLAKITGPEESPESLRN